MAHGEGSLSGWVLGEACDYGPSINGLSVSHHKDAEIQNKLVLVGDRGCNETSPQMSHNVCKGESKKNMNNGLRINIEFQGLMVRTSNVRRS